MRKYKASATVSMRRYSQALDMARGAGVIEYLYDFVVKQNKEEMYVSVSGPSKSYATKILSNILLDAGYTEKEVKIK
jgi:hypothetical protein